MEAGGAFGFPNRNANRRNAEMCGCGSSTTKAGPAAEAAPGVLRLTVPEMTCGHCVGAITGAFGERLPGVPVMVDLATRTVELSAPEAVARAILAEAGYEAMPV